MKLILAILVGIASILLLPQQTAAAEDSCLVLNDITHMDKVVLKSLKYNFSNDGYYFCASSAPAQFSCSCGSTQTCTEFKDPYGRDLGECTCCALWVYVLLLLFLGMLGFSLLVAVYGCLCRGKWWCDGYPPPVVPLLARRGAPIVVPGQIPLPSNLFRNYRSRDFDSGLPPGVLEAEQERRARRRREARRRRAEANQAANADGASSGAGQTSPTTAEGQESPSATAASTATPVQTTGSPTQPSPSPPREREREVSSGNPNPLDEDSPTQQASPTRDMFPPPMARTSSRPSSADGSN